MENVLKNLPYSVWDSFLSFFSLRDRRIDVIKEKIQRQRDAEKIKSDWLKVGQDLNNALPKAKPCEKENKEELCNA